MTPSENGEEKVQISQSTNYTHSFWGKTMVKKTLRRDPGLLFLHKSSWWCLEPQLHFHWLSKVCPQNTEETNRAVKVQHLRLHQPWQVDLFIEQQQRDKFIFCTKTFYVFIFNVFEHQSYREKDGCSIY